MVGGGPVIVARGEKQSQRSKIGAEQSRRADGALVWRQKQGFIERNSRNISRYAINPKVLITFLYLCIVLALFI